MEFGQSVNNSIFDIYELIKNSDNKLVWKILFCSANHTDLEIVAKIV